jgi:sulfhydrogenase subunit delta
MADKKLFVGWFSFSCCEDSTIMMTELLNDNLDWLKVVDFKYAKVLRQDRPIGPMDVAFVEGAITSQEQEDKLKKIRENCTKLIAIGSCAVTAMPSGQRNNFDDVTKEEIQFLIDRFKMSDRVHKLEDLVTVDGKVTGCPMNTKKFIELIAYLLKEFKIV